MTANDFWWPSSLSRSTFGMSMMAECGGGGPKSLLMQRSCFQKRDASARRKRAEGEKASSRLAWLIEGEYINYVLGKRSTGAGRGTARVAQFYQHESSSRRRECGPSVYFLLWNSRRVVAASRCKEDQECDDGGRNGRRRRGEKKNDNGREETPCPSACWQRWLGSQPIWGSF